MAYEPKEGEKLSRYTVTAIEWECWNQPEDGAEIVEEPKLPITFVGPAGMSEEDVRNYLIYDYHIDEPTLNIEGGMDYEMNIASLEFKEEPLENKATDEEIKDVDELFTNMEDDYQYLRELLYDGDSKSAARLIREFLIPNLKDIASVLDLDGSKAKDQGVACAKAQDEVDEDNLFANVQTDLKQLYEAWDTGFETTTLPAAVELLGEYILPELHDILDYLKGME